MQICGFFSPLPGLNIATYVSPNALNMIWVIKGWKNLPAYCLFLKESTSRQNHHLQLDCIVAVCHFLLSQIITNMSACDVC